MSVYNINSAKLRLLGLVYGKENIIMPAIIQFKS